MRCSSSDARLGRSLLRFLPFCVSACRRDGCEMRSGAGDALCPALPSAPLLRARRFRFGPRAHCEPAAGRTGAKLAGPTSPGPWLRTRSFATVLFAVRSLLGASLMIGWTIDSRASARPATYIADRAARHGRQLFSRSSVAPPWDQLPAITLCNKRQLAAPSIPCVAEITDDCRS